MNCPICGKPVEDVSDPRETLMVFWSAIDGDEFDPIEIVRNFKCAESHEYYMKPRPE